MRSRFRRSLLLAALAPAIVVPSWLLAQEPRPEGAEQAEEGVHDLRQQRRYEDALAELDRATARFPDDPQLHGLYPWIYLRGLHEEAVALDWARRLQTRFPKHDVGFFWEAATHREAERWEECISTLRRSPHFVRYHERSPSYATCLYHADRWPEALAALPGPDQYGTGFERFAGWPLWLEGRIARRQILERRRAELEAEAACTAPGCRARLLVKLAVLGVPQVAELAVKAAEGGSAELGAAAAGLREILLAPPRFRDERPRPSLVDGNTLPVDKAIAETFELIDSLPRDVEIPPIEGRYLQEEMLEMAKRFPSAAQPMRLEVDDERRSYSLGAGWNPADGSVDLSFEPGRWYSISSVRDGDLTLLSVGLQEEGTRITVMTYSAHEAGLVLSTRTMSELGAAVHVAEHSSRLARVED